MRKPALAALIIAVGVLAALPFRSNPVSAGSDTSYAEPPIPRPVQRADESVWVEYTPPSREPQPATLDKAPRWNPPEPSPRLQEIADLPRYRPASPPERPRDLPLTFDDLMLPIHASRPIGGSVPQEAVSSVDSRFAATRVEEAIAPVHKPVMSEDAVLTEAVHERKPLRQPSESIAKKLPDEMESLPKQTAMGQFAGQRAARDPVDRMTESEKGRGKPRQRHWIVQPRN